MTKASEVVANLPLGMLDTLLVEAEEIHEAEQAAARLTEGSLRTSWGLLNWAKAQMSRRAS